MTDDLITWLRQQLEADQRIAEAAGRTCGCHDITPRWVFGDDENDGRIVLEGNPHPTVAQRLTKRWNRSYEDMFVGRHITRHDPASVLADIVAKRAILDLHKPVDGLVWDATGNETHGGKVCGTCCSVDYRDTEQPLGDAYPCRTVRLLAEAYADQPGYREEWQR